MGGNKMTQWPTDTINRESIRLRPYEEVIDITVLSGQANAEIDKDLGGRITRILFKVPDLDGTDTAELKIQNSDNENLFESGELAESATHRLLLSVDLIGTITFRIECSGEQASDRAFKVYVTML